MAEVLKTVKEVFKDFDNKSNILECKIEKINIFKKTSKLEIDLQSDSYIQIKEIMKFENYLKERFLLSSIEIDMKYSENVDIPKIESTWKSIVEYMSNKYPLTKVLLQNSTVSVENNFVSVILPVVGAEFLTARGFEKILENTLKT